MKLNKYMLVAAAFMMVAAASAGTTMAYFTDTHQTTGSVLVTLGDSELTPNDYAEGLLKTVSITNTSQYDAYVRVKALYSSNFEADLTQEATSNGWSENQDGYFYYKPVLAAGETTPELKLQITVKNHELAENFNVVIIEEATRVIYDEQGNESCDWNKKVMSRESYDAEFSKVSNGEGDSNE